MANKTSNRREEAREKARLLREAQERREKRNRALMIGGALAAVALVVFVVWLIVSNGTKSAVEKLEAAQVPANTSRTTGAISVGRELAAGSDNGDEVPRVDVYLDYTCHYCLQFEDQYADYLDQIAKDGTATVDYHPIGLLDRSGDFSGYSGRSASAAGTVAAEDPEHFLDAHRALAAMGQRYIDSQGQDEADAATLAAELEKAGVAPEVAKAAGENQYPEWVEATTRQFGRDGFEGTPTILVDGERVDDWSQPEALQKAVEAAK